MFISGTDKKKNYHLWWGNGIIKKGLTHVGGGPQHVTRWAACYVWGGDAGDPVQSSSVSRACSLLPPSAPLLCWGERGGRKKWGWCSITRNSCFWGWKTLFLPLAWSSTMGQLGISLSKNIDRYSLSEAVLGWTLTLQGAPALTSVLSKQWTELHLSFGRTPIQFYFIGRSSSLCSYEHKDKGSEVCVKAWERGEKEKEGGRDGGAGARELIQRGAPGSV